MWYRCGVGELESLIDADPNFCPVPHCLGATGQVTLLLRALVACLYVDVIPTSWDCF